MNKTPCQQCEDDKWRWGDGDCQYDTRDECERANEEQNMKNQRNWYSITNKGESAEILIYDVIGKDFWGDGISAKEFAEEVSALDVGTINIRINSPGGAVFEGTSIYNSLVGHPARITVAIDGMAASIASVIAMAGDHISMAENAMMMIHDPYGLSIGTAEDHRKQADMQDKAKHIIVKTYQNHVEKDEQELSDMMSEETWMTADEALEHGFVHEVTSAMKMAASYDKRILKNYAHVPDGLMDVVSIKPEPKKLEEPPKNSGRSVSHLKKEIDLIEIE